ncbi:lipopolysaccharide synthesis protein wavE [Vibrio ishigakensis]|uniref:Lipopolysaccharide synthesis protein wavE n=1 Tax=Vibrio ishigakensis TaxID=1481914 RepID=A0A0B8PGP0_9VIBR|nr:lipopolysaccharide synthesis protein wavE [Vibrio ishigakensis]
MFDDISVVVQGPVQALSDRSQDEGITLRCLSSIREHLPGAKIILSTWRGQNLEGLDFDELVLCDDPGQNIRQYNEDGTPHFFNNNRQIVSTIEGLKRVKTKYAIKLRSDNYLTCNAFVEIKNKYDKYGQDRVFNERVVVSDIFTRKYAKGLPVAFHISDFFYYGLTSDLQTLWNIDLLSDFIPSDSQPIDPSDPYHLVDCTQLFAIKALENVNVSINLSHLHDVSGNKLSKSESFIANNLIILDSNMLGLGLPEKFKGKARVSKPKGQCTHYQFFEWESLYKQYCDNNYQVEAGIYKKITLFIDRLKYVHPKRFETVFNIYKRKLLKSIR